MIESILLPQAPPSIADAMRQSVRLCEHLGSIADRRDEITHPSTFDACEFETGTFVKAIFESGGDVADHIPAFSRGDRFCVISQHDGGWLHVCEGYLLSSWVVRCNPPENGEQLVREAQAARQSQLLAIAEAETAAAGETLAPEGESVEYVLEKGSSKLGLQIAGGTEDYPEIFIKKALYACVAHRRSTRVAWRRQTADCSEATSSWRWTARASGACHMRRPLPCSRSQGCMRV